MTSAQIKSGFVVAVGLVCSLVALGADDTATRVVAALLWVALYVGEKLEKVVDRLDGISVGKMYEE